MSEIYGIRDAISQGNSYNENIYNTNRDIRELNISRNNEYKNKVNSITKNFKGNLAQDQAKDKLGTLESKVGGGLEAGKLLKTGKDMVRKVPAQLPEASVVEDSFKSPEISQALNRPSEVGYSVQDFHRADAEKIVSRSGMSEQPVVQATEVADAGGEAGEIASGGGKVMGILDKAGKLGGGLAVAGGLLDAGEDIKSELEGKGAIAGKNNLEKAGNVSSMISGGLEGVGLAMDSTGALAPVGLALNVAGAVAGGLGGLFDYLGGKEEKKKAPQQLKKQVSQVSKPAPMRQEALQTQQATPTASVNRSQVVTY